LMHLTNLCDIFNRFDWDQVCARQPNIWDRAASFGYNNVSVSIGLTIDLHQFRLQFCNQE
jgi:hypothetical protein